MRDCIFLVADGNMAAAFTGFLTRSRFNRSLGTAPFAFDPDEDLFVASGNNDPGLYVRGHELLRPFRTTHERAIVVLDAAWEGSPDPEDIRDGILGRLVADGWLTTHVAVIVIDPELEVWVWQDSPHVDAAIGHTRPPSLRQHLIESDLWPADCAKPEQPKELLEGLLRHQRKPRSSAFFRKLCKQISVSRCADPAFRHLRDTLRAWFPAEAGV